MFHQIFRKIFQYARGSLDTTSAPQLVLQALWTLIVGQMQITHILAFVLAELDSCAAPSGEVWDALRKNFNIDASYHLMLDLKEILSLALSVDQAGTHVARQERLLKISELFCGSTL